MRSHWFFTLCSLMAAVFVGIAFFVPRLMNVDHGGVIALASLAPAAGSAPGNDGAPGKATQPTPGIGGPFALTDQNGRTVTDADLKGHYSLIAFGFTFCPDVCPTTLASMTQAINALGAEGDQVLPVFITVDPERDTPGVMKEYAAHFHPRLRALTGSPKAVKQAVGAYKVYASSHRKDAADKDYTVDHSAFIYLMGPDGQYITHFPYNIAPDALSAAIGDVLHHRTRG